MLYSSKYPQIKYSTNRPGEKATKAYLKIQFTPNWSFPPRIHRRGGAGTDGVELGDLTSALTPSSPSPVPMAIPLSLTLSHEGRGNSIWSRFRICGQNDRKSIFAINSTESWWWNAVVRAGRRSQPPPARYSPQLAIARPPQLASHQGGQIPSQTG